MKLLASFGCFFCKCCFLLLISREIVHSLQFNVINTKTNLKSKRSTSVKLRNKREADIAFGKSYLTNYGYMPPSSLRSGEEPAEESSWKRALIQLQRFFSLNETGQLDDVTLQLMKKPRCGNHDKIASLDSTGLRRRKRYVKVGSRWQSVKVTYSINNFTPKLGEKKTHEAIDAAFAAWSKHVPLEFKKVSYKDKPDIVTFFAEGYHNDNTAFDGKGGFLAHAYYPGTGIGGDTHFDGAEPWTLYEKPYSGNDLFLVAVHELGHALGLGHSQNQDAIMAPIYKHHDTKNFELPRDDIYGIQSIYGERYERPNIPIVPTTTLLPPSSSIKPVKPNGANPRKPYQPPHAPRPPVSTTTKPPLPDVCELSHYDAVSFLRRELYVFSGEYMWRRQVHETSMQGPYKITSFWAHIKDGVSAVYENPVSQKIIFFKGHLYWEYDGISLAPHFPRPVRFLGLQNEHIGAAVWWEKNGKSYIFQGSNYWRLGEYKVDYGYPKPINIWKDIPSSVDAAFTDVDAKGKNFTYFVKGNKYWIFNNDALAAEGPPRSFQQDWLLCGSTKIKIEKSNAVAVAVPVLLSLLLLAILVYIFYKRRTSASKSHLKTVTSLEKPPRPPLYSAPFCSKVQPPPAGVQYHLSEQKAILVTTAQQKLRWLRFSLQGQV